MFIMAEKYVMFNLDDERLENLAEVLNNKTARKIVSYLAEKESSEGDIVRDLHIAANTVNYNIKKLLESGLIEKTSTYFWSVKGKKIPQYKVSKKTIMISPKHSSSAKSLLSAFLATGIVAFLIKAYTASHTFATVGDQYGGGSGIAEVATSGSAKMAGFAAPSAGGAPSLLPAAPIPELWIWFLLGGLTALLFYMLLNWRKL